MSEQSTADLYDRFEEAMQSVATQFRSVGGRTRFSGTIRTIQCFEDNALVRSVLRTNGVGQVLVVDGGGSLRTALMGDLIAGSAVENGWEGVILNGAIRDSAAIALLPIGVKALGTNPRKSGKTGTGAVDVEVTFADTVFTPGRAIYCDEDGILVER